MIEMLPLEARYLEAYHIDDMVSPFSIVLAEVSTAPFGSYSTE